MADEFEKKNNVSIKKNPKPMIKLMKSCNKLKEVHQYNQTLSANKETRFFVENLYDGIDFQSQIKR